MGILADFLNRKRIDHEANVLVKLFIKRLPKERAGNSKLLSAELQILLGNARGYQRQSKLSFFGTARLGNCIRWALIEAGYDSELAKNIGQELSVSLASDKSKTN